MSTKFEKKQQRGHKDIDEEQDSHAIDPNEFKSTSFSPKLRMLLFFYVLFHTNG